MERRRFFRQFLAESVSYCEALSGKPQMRLADLWTVPDSVLADLAPAVIADFELVDVDTRLCARNKGSGRVIDLGTADDSRAFAVRCFDGSATAAAVASRVSEQYGCDSTHAFSLVKEIFLKTVRLGVCLPVNQLPPEHCP